MQQKKPLTMLRLCIIVAVLYFGGGNRLSAQEITLGYLIGQDDELKILETALEVTKSKGTVSVTYDKTTTHSTFSNASTRFDNQSAHPTDLMIVCTGRTSQLDEISRLAQEGRIQPIDVIPGIQDKIREYRFPRNIMEPCFYNGVLYALPFRICPPCMIVPREREPQVTVNWDQIIQIAQEAGATYMLEAEPYFLWRTLLGGMAPSQRGREEMTSAFKSTTTLLGGRERGTWDAKFGIGMVVPDVFAIEKPMLVQTMECVPYPGQLTPVYSSENSWFLAVSAHVPPNALSTVAAALETLLSPEVQMQLAETGASSPAALSIVESAEFQAKYPAGSPQSTFATMMKRLRFRTADKKAAELELVPVFRDAFYGKIDVAELVNAAIQLEQSNTKEGW